MLTVGKFLNKILQIQVPKNPTGIINLLERLQQNLILIGLIGGRIINQQSLKVHLF